jgi:hypothetical protein
VTASSPIVTENFDGVVVNENLLAELRDSTNYHSRVFMIDR